MQLEETGWQGWRGVALIAITYVYFLIFAQFAFLKRLGSLGIADAHLKAVMGAMAFGGILVSVVAPRVKPWPGPVLRLRTALFSCTAAAGFTLLPLGLAASMGVAFLIGSGLGLLTVTLVTHLRLWLGSGNPLLRVGLGTGIGYFICNLPALFTASAGTQAITAGALCLVGTLVVEKRATALPVRISLSVPASLPFARVLVSFTALVWLDSAAFFIIQNTPALKAGTWEGTVHLWINGLLHLAGALGAVWCLRRRGLPVVITFAFLSLAAACLLLLDPRRAVLASLFYPVGVSFYSVALVAYPALLGPATSTGGRGRQAGWIYAIAGWFGSAMGIGMAQDLGHVPAAFVWVAGAAVLLPELVRWRRREVAATAAVLGIAFCIERAGASVEVKRLTGTAVERGRQVYIGEGCINCHSQYVRPNSPDVLMWGPVQTLEQLRREHPPLIGNRRQGPDLAEVGNRRSALWLEAHFYDPAEVNRGSFMPGYGYLFENRRGSDLIAYLQSLRPIDDRERLVSQMAWRLPAGSFERADDGTGEQLFLTHCATCHANGDVMGGRTRERWRASFKRLPPNLATGPFAHLPASDSRVRRRERLAQIIKFGIPGTDMAGHEYLPDDAIASLSAWLAQRTAEPIPSL